MTESVSKTLSTEDYQIINATFPHLVMPSPSGTTREFGYDNFNLKDRELPSQYIRNVVFTNVLVPLNDTIVFYPKPNNRLKIEDATVQKLYYKLFSDEQSEAIIEIDSITNTGFWKLTPVQRGQKIKREIGDRVISYSRIVYNTDITKAVFYFQNNCSGLCGFGLFVVVEKVNGIWTITKEYHDWVS